MCIFTVKAVWPCAYASEQPNRCNRPEFPPSQFFPRGKNGPAHSFPGEKIGRPILSPPSQFFPPLIISKIIMELLFLCINLKSRYKISHRSQNYSYLLLFGFDFLGFRPFTFTISLLVYCTLSLYRNTFE